MNAQSPLRNVVIGMLVLAFAAPSTVQAADRRFEPVSQSAAQVVKVVADSSIISAAGKLFHAGASIAPESSRKAWLSVSVKNMSAEPLPLVADAIAVTGNGQPLKLENADEVTKKGQAGDGYVRDPCANATSNSQLNCNIDDFNRKQANRMEDSATADKPAAEQLGSGQLVVKQYQVDLPKPSKAGPAMLKVSVTLGGEQITFDFKEVN